MKRVTLFIAMSLDGYIADKNGGVGWLAGHSPDGEDMAGYFEFIKEIDTVILGWTTYHQIVTELSPNEWMYKGLTSYVLTHRALPAQENIHFVSESAAALVTALRGEEGRGIWICGGAGVIQPLIRENLIDVFHISIIPTILGEGLRLFEASGEQRKLRLLKTQSYNGITDVIYERRLE